MQENNEQADTPCCEHKWVSNSGRGGRPKFIWQWCNRTTKVKCSECNIQVWMNPAEWAAYRRAVPWADLYATESTT